MATTAKNIQLGGIARHLVDDGVVEQEKILLAQQEALKEKIPLVTYLVKNKIATSDKVALSTSQAFGIPLLNIQAIEIDKDVVKLANEKLINKHHVLPVFKRGKRLYIAVSDPTNLRALDEIKFAAGMSTEAVLVEEDKLVEAIEQALSDMNTGLSDIMEDEFDDLDNLDTADYSQSQQDDDSDIDDAPVVRFVNKILLDAIKQGGSDLHFEPYEKFYRVRFRVDGILAEISKPPRGLTAKIAARIKVMSRLDVSEKRVPQDGRIKLKLSKSKSIDFRVSTCPTLFGEKIVMRILNSDAAALQIDALGYEDRQKELFLENLHRPYGMFLVTGPTGSGKTVSLYSGINILNEVDVNISTAEDPVEINLPGINQVQIDERTGMTFDKALKSFLRQDPDIILVGEIRDLGTATIAVKAAQTGHMVMSTLHTNDGPQTLTRLQDMGIQPFAIATSINLITAQRLLRRLHPDYKKPFDITKDALLAEGFTEEDFAEDFTIYEPGDGGSECPSGYKGRAGIYQVMPISEELKRLIISGKNAVELADQTIKEGVWGIRKSGLAKAKSGLTSLSEVNRVTIE